jgi:magnesium transporter
MQWHAGSQCAGVRLNEDNEAEITSVGFVIGPLVLVTVRF